MNLLIPLIVVSAWLVVLTVFTVITFLSFRKFLGNTGKENVIKLLNTVFDQGSKNGIKYEELKKELSVLEGKSADHIQKVSLVKFNPFQELGGNHSFSLALLDGKNTGFVITGLHARDKTRIYLKSIVAGKSDLELSEEESKALRVALRNK